MQGLPLVTALKVLVDVMEQWRFIKVKAFILQWQDEVVNKIQYLRFAGRILSAVMCSASFMSPQFPRSFLDPQRMASNNEWQGPRASSFGNFETMNNHNPPKRALEMHPLLIRLYCRPAWRWRFELRDAEGH